MAEDLRARMRAFYASSEAYKGLLDAHDEAYLAPYARTVLRFAKPGGRVLELGGGNGIGARLIHEAGYRVVGTDLSPLFLKEAGGWQSKGLSYAVADGLQLPFPDGAFDTVCSNEYLEHIPNAEMALREMTRVTAPGGRVVVVGPNLCSPFVPLQEFRSRLRGKRDAHVWTASMSDALRQAIRNARIVRNKRRRDQPDFIYRSPELEERVIGGDADSSYLATATDLEKYFQQHDWMILALAVGHGWKGRLVARFAARYSPHLCVVAERPPKGEQ